MKWIRQAIKRPGALRQALHAKKGEPIPTIVLKKAEMAPGRLGRQARLAATLRTLK
jgi:hypothetical protein